MTPLVPKLFLGTPFYGTGTTLSNASVAALAASAEKYAWIFRCPKSGTLDKFEFQQGTVSLNSASVVRASFQNVSTTVVAAPTETIQQYRDIPASSFGSLGAWMAPGLITSDGTDTGTKRTVSQGDLIACVLEYQAFNTGDSVGIAPMNIPNQPFGHPLTSRKITGAWNSQPSAAPHCVLKYNDGTYGNVGSPWPPATGYPKVGSGTFNTGTTPNEAGLLFRVPISMQIRGAYSYNDYSTAAGGLAAGADFSFNLYDAASHLVGTKAIDATMVRGTDSGGMVIYFPSDMTVLANQDYRLCIKPSTTTNVQFSLWTFVSEAIKNSVADSTWKYTSRTGTGAWTDDGTQLPLCFGMIVSAIGDLPSVIFPRRSVAVVSG